MTAPPRNLLEDLIARGVDDWIDAGMLISLSFERGVKDPLDNRTIAIGLAAEAVFGGLMVAGEISPKDGFVPWSCSPAEAVERIAREWIAREDPMVRPGDIVWLCNTPEGEAIGEAVLRREEEAP